MLASSGKYGFVADMPFLSACRDLSLQLFFLLGRSRDDISPERFSEVDNGAY